MRTITENLTKIKAELPARDVHRKMQVFYNPTMRSNRNISILLLNSISNKNMKLALPLAGSGIRALRFVKELKRGKVKELFVNDFKDGFIGTFNSNLELNKIKTNKINTNNTKTNQIKVYNQEASLFLLNQPGFDYIDIDAFGSSNPFIAAAVARISRKGILAITATDTAALTGTYPKVTKRKYWAKSLRNYMMHELGLRILIRKVQLQGIQFDKALIPVLSYHKDHYFRIYFRSVKGKEKCDQIIKNHQYLLFCAKCLNFTVSNYNSGKCNCGKEFQFAGPLWTGRLFDSKLLSKMAKNNKFPEEQKFLDLLKDESKVDSVGFYDLHTVAKKYKFAPPKMEKVLKKVSGVRTHFSLNGVKSKKGVREILRVVKNK